MAAYLRSAPVSRFFAAALNFCLCAPCALAQTPRQYAVFGLQFSPNGKLLAASSNSADPPGPIVIWRVADWTVQCVHRPAGGTIDLNFSPDGARLAYACKSGNVGVMDVATGKPIWEFEAHKGIVYAVAFCPDGASLASAGDDRTIKLWDVAAAELTRSLAGHTDAVSGVAVSPDGATLLSGGNDHQERLWRIESGEVLNTFAFDTFICRRVGFSRDGQYFLTSRYDGKSRIRESVSGQLRAQLSGGYCADMTADNRLVVTAGGGPAARVFAVQLHDASIDDRRRIAGLIEQFRLDSYEAREAAEAELAAIGMVAEPQLREASNHDDAEVRVRCRRIRRRVLSPQPIAQLGGHRGDVEVACFCPNGRRIATACRGGDIKLWDASDFREIMTLSLNAADALVSQ